VAVREVVMRRWLALIVIVLIGGAYLGGWLPERSRRVEAEARLATLERQLRLAQLEIRLLSLVAAVEARNFGIAASEATRFFDGVGRESGITPASRQAAVDRLLGQRENLTGALTQPELVDPARLRVVLDEMREALHELRSDER
jgi:hypothetical protein